MPMGYMDWGLFVKIIGQIKSGDIILAWRGEPSLHPALYSMAFRSPVPPVIATNGTIPQKIPIKLVKAINVSIHNADSLTGLKLIAEFRPNDVKLTTSRVLGEIPEDLWEQVKGLVCTEYREYQEHSAGGVWGSIRAGGPRYTLSGQRKGLCHRLETDLVIAWDGSISRCCYVWETIPGLNVSDMTLSEIWQSPELQGIRDRYPDHICSLCDQWRDTKTL